ncbi:MAG: formyltetrahydrofolate deformylase [Nitrospirae bacterium]|nr:formyltetrahydrofolate deformylase [Candidatus Manganitrophaceae bacterium]
MENTNAVSGILLVSCPDQKGLIASVTAFIHENKGNIIGLEQHVEPIENHFFMRVQWDLEGFEIPSDQFEARFEVALARPFAMSWSFFLSNERPRMAIFISKYSHCLYDILSRYQAGEWQVEIPLIISNHPELENVAKNVGIDFHCIPITLSNKPEQEAVALRLLKKYKIEFIVLARYMQILSADFTRHYPHRIINIHHSFLPAFPGAKPYHSAYQRGVKIIGVTSHYVTAELDGGPIIEQDVVPVSHTDLVADYVRKGRDLEKVVLARAIWRHLNRKILVFKNRTLLFS